MNSMTGAYHKTKTSSDKEIERKQGKRRSKSLSGQSEPASPTRQKTLTKDDSALSFVCKKTLSDGIVPSIQVEKTVLDDCVITSNEGEKTFSEDGIIPSVKVEEDNNKLEEKGSELDNSHHRSSNEDVSSVTETKYTLDTTDKDLDNDSTSDGSVFSDAKHEVSEQKQDGEQKPRKDAEKGESKMFFISSMSADAEGSDTDEKSPLEPVIASSSKDLDWVIVNSTSNAKENNVNIPVPFSQFVDMRRLNEALTTEKVYVDHDHHLTVDALKQILKKKEEKSLKKEIRHNNWGADHKIRELLWQLLCKYLHKAHQDDTYEEFAKDMFPADSPGSAADDIPLPPFVDYTHIECFSLTTEGLTYSKKVTCVMEHTNPDITYCPLLLPLVSLFLHYMDPSASYTCAYSLLREKEDAYIPQTNVSFEASKLVIRDLAKKYAKHCYSHLSKHCGDFDTFFNDWVWWIFCDLPFPYLVRVIDCFISEGFKIFYRVVLALLIIYAKSHAKKTSKVVPDILHHFRQFCKGLPVTVDKLLKVAFSIKGFSRKEVKKLLVKHTMYINSVRMVTAHNEQNSHGALMARSFSGPTGRAQTVPISRSFSGPLLLHQQINSSIVALEMLYAIWSWIPTRYAVCQPLLLYTSEEHGISLVTLYSRVENYQPTIIIIKNTEDEIFGAYCSTYWRERNQSTKNLSYFGTGETFIFTLSPEKLKYDWVGLKEENIPNTAYMFQAGDRRVLTIGGGNGEAILLDENLLHCRTESCDTFANEPLCGKNDFACKVVEVYGFQ